MRPCKFLNPILLLLSMTGNLGTAQKPKDTVVLFGDDANIFYYPAYPMTPEHLENWVGDFASKRIDILSWDVEVNGVLFYGTKVGQRPWQGRAGYPTLTIKQFAENLNHLIEIGADPPKVVADVCHRNGLKMLAAFRMGAARAPESRFRLPDGSGVYYNKFFAEHPEFLIKENTYVNDAVDWSFPEVRAHMLRGVSEVAEAYPVDGVELNFIRDYALIFPPSQALSKAPIMTDVIAQVRQMLERAAAKRRTGRLLLAVRVPNDLRLCRESGLDVGAWVKQGFVDFVMPDQRHGMTGDAQIEDFVALCAGAKCKVLPALHPNPSEPLYPLSRLRGVADNWYRRGAAGISTFNWPHPFPPGFFRELRDPARVASGERTYPFAGELIFKKAELGTRQSLQLPTRIAALSDPDSRRRARLRFTAVELDREDDLRVDVDGRPLAPLSLEWTLDAQMRGLLDGAFAHGSRGSEDLWLVNHAGVATSMRYYQQPIEETWMTHTLEVPLPRDGSLSQVGIRLLKRVIDSDVSLRHFQIVVAPAK